MANEFRQAWDVRGTFLVWKTKMQERQSEREEYAKDIWEAKIWTKYFKSIWLTRLKALHQQQKQVEARWEIKVEKGVLSMWRNATKNQIFRKMEIQRMKELKADECAKLLVPRRFLRKWRDAVQDMKEERWREFRKQELRRRAKVYCAFLNFGIL
jgi:hypothetical protein